MKEIHLKGYILLTYFTFLTVRKGCTSLKPSVVLYHVAMDKKIIYPTRRAHYVGTSVVVTLDPSHVKRLQIDELTFFVQKPVENGIVLEMCRLNAA
jgi:hypothetical protein